MENTTQDLGGLMLELQKELQDFRKENQEIQADLKMLRKIFSYRVKKATKQDIVQGRVNDWLMKKLAKC